MIRQRTKAIKRYISLLVNSILYYLDHVLIISEKGQFRLVVILKNKKLIDKTFKTPGGARISFSKSFGKQAEKGTRPEWSHFYPPEHGFLDNFLNLPVKRK